MNRLKYIALGLLLFLANPAMAVTTVSSVQATASAATTGAGSISFDVSLHNISNNSAATEIAWSSVTLPASFIRASSYIKLNSTITAGGAGIQIYTNNTLNSASPKFTGSAEDNPAGLVDTVSTQRTLPLAWSIKDGLDTAPAAADPNNFADSNSFQWMFMKDYSYQPNPIVFPNRMFPFIPAEDYVTVRIAGLLHGVSPNQYFSATSPDYLYFEADFRNAVTPRAYRTSTLTLEAFMQ